MRPFIQTFLLRLRLLLLVPAFALSFVPSSVFAAAACGSSSIPGSQCYDECPDGWTDVGGFGDGCGFKTCCQKAAIPADLKKSCVEQANGAMSACRVKCEAGESATDSPDCKAAQQLCCIASPGGAPPAAAAGTAPGGAVTPPLTSPATTGKFNADFDAKRKGYGLDDPFNGATVPVLVGRIISFALPLVGSLFLLMFIWGGITWMMAEGDQKKVQQAQNILRNAVIGFTIVVSAYFLVTKVLAILNPAVDVKQI